MYIHTLHLGNFLLGTHLKNYSKLKSAVIFVEMYYQGGCNV